MPAASSFPINYSTDNSDHVTQFNQSISVVVPQFSAAHSNHQHSVRKSLSDFEPRSQSDTFSFMNKISMNQNKVQFRRQLQRETPSNYVPSVMKNMTTWPNNTGSSPHATFRAKSETSLRPRNHRILKSESTGDITAYFRSNTADPLHKSQQTPSTKTSTRTSASLKRTESFSPSREEHQEYGPLQPLSSPTIQQLISRAEAPFIKRMKKVQKKSSNPLDLPIGLVFDYVAPQPTFPHQTSAPPSPMSSARRALNDSKKKKNKPIEILPIFQEDPVLPIDDEQKEQQEITLSTPRSARRMSSSSYNQQRKNMSLREHRQQKVIASSQTELTAFSENNRMSVSAEPAPLNDKQPSPQLQIKIELPSNIHKLTATRVSTANHQPNQHHHPATKRKLATTSNNTEEKGFLKLNLSPKLQLKPDFSSGDSMLSGWSDPNEDNLDYNDMMRFIRP